MEKAEILDFAKERIGQSMTLYVRTFKYVESCVRCDGRGYTSTEELTDYHNGIYSDVHKPCGDCHGEGRMTCVKKTIVANFRMSSSELWTHTSKIAYSADPITAPVSTQESVSVGFAALV